MLGKEDCPFATTGWTQVEALAGKRPKVIMTAFGVGTANTRDALEIVAARRESLAQLLDALKAIPAVGCGVLLIVVLAEVGEVSLEYGMELAAATGNVLIPRRGRKRDGRAHIIVYGRNQLFASDRELVHRSPHNVSHSPDAFSSLRSCEGAGDAVVMFHRESEYSHLGRLSRTTNISDIAIIWEKRYPIIPELLRIRYFSRIAGVTDVQKALWGKDLGHRESGAFFVSRVEVGHVEF
jgi:hypothetical protein